MTIHIFIGRKVKRRHAVIVRESCCNREMQQHSDQKNKELYFFLIQQCQAGWCKSWAPLLAVCAPHLLPLSSQALVDTGWLHRQVPAIRKEKEY